MQLRKGEADVVTTEDVLTCMLHALVNLTNNKIYKKNDTVTKI